MTEMQAEPLRLNGFTRVNRQRMIPLVREALLKSGGDIPDFHFFSNISLCINFELSALRLPKLQAALEAIDLRLSNESRELLATFPAAEESVEEESHTRFNGTLQITFIHNEPDLRLEVPAIPG